MKPFCIALAACGAFLSVPGLAQQFTFTVPVQVSNLPPTVELMRVTCGLYYGTPLRTIGDPATRETIVTIPQVPSAAGGTVGEFSGDVVVVQNVRPGLDPALVTHYSCRGLFQGTEGGAVVGYFDTTNPDSPRFPLADGAPFRLDTGIQPLPR
jgi:hypothetical protein